MRAVTRGAATSLPGASKAAQRLAGHPVRGPDTPPAPHKATFTYKSPQLDPPAPPAQAASLPLISHPLPAVLPLQVIPAIRAGLPHRGHRRSFRVMTSKPSALTCSLLTFCSPTLCSGRCYNWFVAIDQDNSGEISPQELRMCPFSKACDQFDSWRV